MNIQERPTEMLMRQLQAYRNAAKDRKHYGHLPQYASKFAQFIREVKAALKSRGSI